MSSLRQRAVLLGAAVAFALAIAAPAGAYTPTRPDSDAPPGAAPDWLPDEPWVMERWMPFDEAQLHRVLRLDANRVWMGLDQSMTLRAMAVARGVPTRGLADRLLASRRGTVPARTYRILRSRTRRMLTQQHLGEHMLWHVFHQRSVLQQAPGVLALGLSLSELRARALSAAGASGRRGVRNGAMSARENRFLRARDRQVTDAWLGRPTTGTVARAARTPVLCPLG